MQTKSFTSETKECLIGMKIVEVGDNYIVFDNGLRIYIEENEIELVNL